MKSRPFGIGFFCWIRNLFLRFNGISVLGKTKGDISVFIRSIYGYAVFL